MPESALTIELNDKPEYQRLLGGSPQTCGMRAGRVHLKPGESVGEHTTGDLEEMLVFLAGRGQALIGEEKQSHPVGVGKVAYIPPRTKHDVENTGTEPLVYIFCVAPAKELPSE